jgi:ELWxxDGT repeat protein
MRSLAKWILWWLVSMICAAIGVLLGFVVAVVVYPILSFASFFLLVCLGGLGIVAFGLVGAAGGSVAGIVIGSIQDHFLEGSAQHIEQWVKIAKIAWAFAGFIAAGGFLSIERGDLSPLVWFVALGAVMAGAAQWIGLRNKLQQAGWRALVSTLGTLSGGLFAVVLLGAMSDRGPLDPLQRAITFREFIYRAGATGLTSFNGRLLFFVTAEDTLQEKWWELWTSDGTPAGTVPVRRAFTGWNQPNITLETQFNEMLFFSANGVLDEAYAQSWKNHGGQWRTDGTSAGTMLLDYYLSDSIVLAGELYFRMAPEGSSCTLYKVTRSDTSPSPIRQLTGTCEGEIAAGESTLFFLTREEETKPPLCTLWRSDGTAAGTLAIAAFEQDLRHDCPSDLLAVNERLFMITPTAAELELWISDGTPAGTLPVTKLEGVTEPLSYSSPIRANGIYFVVLAEKTETCALWRSDGTPEGTFRLKPLCTLELTRLGNTLIFVERRDQGGWDLWRSDGTVEGTVVVSGFFSALENLAPKLIAEINGDLFWVMGDRETCSLWKSHGIQVGMTLVARLCPSESTNVNGTLFLVTQKNEFTVELWRSDGTGSGTTLMRTIP